MFNIDRLDHLVLTVANIEATCAFYSSVLGMKVQSFSGDRRALRFGNQKINLHQIGHGFDPKAQNPTAGSGDLCFISSTPLEEIVEHLALTGVIIEEGPVGRTGATGPIRSVYLRDPDGNLVEISNY